MAGRDREETNVCNSLKQRSQQSVSTPSSSDCAEGGPKVPKFLVIPYVSAAGWSTTNFTAAQYIRVKCVECAMCFIKFRKRT